MVWRLAQCFCLALFRFGLALAGLAACVLPCVFLRLCRCFCSILCCFGLAFPNLAESVLLCRLGGLPRCFFAVLVGFGPVRELSHGFSPVLFVALRNFGDCLTASVPLCIALGWSGPVSLRLCCFVGFGCRLAASALLKLVLGRSRPV